MMWMCSRSKGRDVVMFTCRNNDRNLFCGGHRDHSARYVAREFLRHVLWGQTHCFLVKAYGHLKVRIVFYVSMKQHGKTLGPRHAKRTVEVFLRNCFLAELSVDKFAQLLVVETGVVLHNTEIIQGVVGVAAVLHALVGVGVLLCGVSVCGERKLVVLQIVRDTFSLVNPEEGVAVNACKTSKHGLTYLHANCLA